METTSTRMQNKLYAFLDIVFHNIPTHKLAALSVTLQVLSWVDVLDIGIRAVGIIVSIIVGWYAVQNYRYDIRIKKRTLAQKEKEEVKA